MNSLSIIDPAEKATSLFNMSTIEDHEHDRSLAITQNEKLEVRYYTLTFGVLGLNLP